MFQNRFRRPPSNFGKRYLALFLLMTCLFAGCDEETLTSVTGKVTFQGQPVVQGDITFFKSTTGEVAQGSLGEAGAYSLYISENGLSPGQYKVTVTPSVSYEKVKGPGGSDMKMIEQGGKSIPEKYRDRSASRLRATVESGNNVFDFDMKP